MSRTRASLRIGPELIIPGQELVIDTARSGGPGGQNVNKVETKVILRYDVRRSRVLTEEQRLMLLDRLAGRLTKEGEIVLHCSQHRERRRNEVAARERLYEILAAALAPRIPRMKTRPTRSGKEKRLRTKRVRSEVKRRRTRRTSDE